LESDQFLDLLHLARGAEFVAVLSHEFGNEWGTLLVIWIVGGVIAWRAKILHITFTYVAAFLLLAPLRAWLGHADLRTEIAPITGPMYQLFIFFMITDRERSCPRRSGASQSQ